MKTQLTIDDLAKINSKVLNISRVCPELTWIEFDLPGHSLFIEQDKTDKTYHGTIESHYIEHCDTYSEDYDSLQELIEQEYPHLFIGSNIEF